MKTRNGAIAALLLLATCTEEAPNPGSSGSESSSGVESARRALGKIPSSESAVWQKVGSSNTPDGRYLQAIAFDDARKVAVMFGGTNYSPNTGLSAPNQETWEWSTSTGKWTNRTSSGTTPDARSGAAMAYDSKRVKFVLFGGRAGSGYNLEDTWEWDPGTGEWTDVTNAGSHPSARSQHVMVYEASAEKILLFGGGRSDANSYDATGVSMSFGDTWELDPSTHTWTALNPTASPKARHDCAMVWDSSRKKAVLFGGIQVDMSGVTGVPKQDTWDWDPAGATWTERTSSGAKPKQRYGHAMAFDGSRGKVVMFGGFDISTGGDLNELWDWDPSSAAWTERMTGSETPMPSPRRYASLVSNDAGSRLELIAGGSSNYPWGMGGTGGGIIYPPGMFSIVGTREVWELDPAKPAFTDRTAPLDVPIPRTGHAMAYNSSTGKTYMFGGVDQTVWRYLDDLWAWDGQTWSQVTVGSGPSARYDAALAFDPARKSLILFGGSGNNGSENDTWEWTPAKGWVQLFPTTSPDPLMGHGMVTDTTRSKILLFGGYSDSYWKGGPVGGPGIPYKEPMRNDVWEWDGNSASWTNRSPTAGTMPTPRQYPAMAYDSGQKKLFVYDGTNFSVSMGAYWEWDPVTTGWATHDTGDSSEYGYATSAVYDSIRRRVVMVVQASNYMTGSSNNETWEMDANSQTLYVRSIVSPYAAYSAAMAFDSARGVVVLFGGQSGYGNASDDTWEYRVTGLGNGEGCHADTASSCASGYCVDGVCCDAASCSGPCKSCSVRGHEGTCYAAQAGTEVPGSCSNGKACDGNGNCTASNGEPCSTGSSCASGNCVDGVCCDNACKGTCMACNQTGSVGKCTPYTAGTDPQSECAGKGTGVCKAACDGVSGCGFPQYNVKCDKCMSCDGFGSCSNYDPYCGGFGGYPYGSGGYPYGSGGYPYGTGGFFTGGSGGRTYGSGGYPYGGSGGYTTGRGGAGGSATGGSYPFTGGSGGGTTARGGAGGTTTGGSAGASARGGTAGSVATGGTSARGGAGGFGGTPPGVGGAPGTGGTPVATGGVVGQGGSVSGSGGKADGGPAKGGSTGKRDGGGDEIDAMIGVHLSRADCSCAVGRATSSTETRFAPLLGLGMALLLVRRRRRR